MPDEKIVKTPSLELWTESLGDPTGPPLLLISGAGAHAHFWSDSFCQPLIQRGFFLIRYDHRDVGLSEAASHDYELQDLVEDAIRILDAYNIRSAHIVGHSMGGYLGQFMALSHLERMRSLTVISAGPAGETPELRLPQTPEERVLFQETWLILLRNRPTQNFEESYPGFLTVWERLNGKFPVEERLARPYTEEMYTRTHHLVGAHVRHMRVMQRVGETLKERKEMFKALTLPILIIQGAEDPLVPVQRGGKALALVLPQAKLEIIPKMGHMLFDYALEKEVAERVIAFLTDQENCCLTPDF